MKKVLLILLVLAPLISPITYARGVFDNNSALLLVKSCREVLEIFKSRDEKKFLAAQRTSLSEAMRAGYCIGAVQNFNCESSRKYGNWLVKARSIAAVPNTDEDLELYTQVDVLNQFVCN